MTSYGPYDDFLTFGDPVGRLLYDHTYNLFYLWKNAMFWEDLFEILLES